VSSSIAIDDAVRPDGFGQHAGEEPGAAVQVQRHVAWLRLQRSQDGLGERAGRARVHLPERPGAHPPGPSRGLLLKESAAAHRREPAVAAGCEHRVRREIRPGFRTDMTARDDQRSLARAGGNCHFHFIGAMPALAGHAGITDQVMRDRAVADLDDLMGPVPAQPGDTIAGVRRT
jgi:hypothetical protein